MKKILLLFIIMALPIVVLVSQVNLVPNPNMEDWSSGSKAPVGYSVVGTHTDPDLGFYLSSDAKSGSHALNVKYSGTGSYRFNTPQIPNLKAGVYTIKIWVKGKGVLRWITLTKQTSDGKAGTPSNSFSDGNYGISPMGGSTVSSIQDLTDWTEFTGSFTINEGYEGDYNLHVSVNNTREEEGKPFLFDDISLIYTPISQIRVKDETATTPSPIPGFKADVFNYVVPVSFNYGGSPVVDVAPTSLSPDYNQSPSMEENSIGTASIEVNNGAQSAAYTVTFEKQPDYIDGCPISPSGSAYKYAGQAMVSNLYVDAGGNHGEYLGGRGFRNNSKGEGTYETPILTSGAGVLSFYVKQYEPIHPDTISYLKVVLRTATVDYDQDRPLLVIPSSDLTNQWRKIEVNIESQDPTTQIKIYSERVFREDGNALRNFYFDDVKITPSINSSLPVFPFQTIPVTYAGENKFIFSLGATPVLCQIYSSLGTLLYVGKIQGEKVVSVKEKGLYVIRIGDKSVKIIAE